MVYILWFFIISLFSQLSGTTPAPKEYLEAKAPSKTPKKNQAKKTIPTAIAVEETLVPIAQKIFVPKHLEFIVTHLSPLFEDEIYAEIIDMPLSTYRHNLPTELQNVSIKQSIQEWFEEFKIAVAWYESLQKSTHYSPTEFKENHRYVNDVRNFLDYLFKFPHIRTHKIVLACIKECIQKNILDFHAEKAADDTPYYPDPKSFIPITDKLKSNFFQFFNIALQLYTNDINGICETTQQIETLDGTLLNMFKDAFLQTKQDLTNVHLQTTKISSHYDQTCKKITTITSLILSIPEKSINQKQCLLVLDTFSSVFPEAIVNWILEFLLQQAIAVHHQEQEKKVQAWDENLDSLLQELGCEDTSPSKQSSAKVKKPKTKGKSPAQTKASKSDPKADPAATDTIPLDQYIANIYARHVHSDDDIAGFVTYQSAHRNRTTIQDGESPGSKIIYDPYAKKIINLALATEKNTSCPVWFRVGQVNYAMRIGSKGKRDYRHMFPEAVDRLLEYATWTKQTSSYGELEDHAEIIGSITDTETGSIFPCIFEFTFNKDSRECYHRFAARQRTSSSS